MTKYEVKIGDQATFHGDFVVANAIQNSFNKTSASEATQELKEKLTELHKAVAAMCSHLDEDEANGVARDLDALTNEAVARKPRRDAIQGLADRIVKVAKTVGEVAVPVVAAVQAILPLFVK